MGRKRKFPKLSLQRMSPRRWLFVKYYCITLNATQAAIQAGYSKASAMKMGSFLKNTPIVRAEIAKNMAKVGSRIDITVERVLEMLIANHDAAFAKGDHSACNQALKMLGQHLAMYTERVDMRVTTSHAALIMKAQTRVEAELKQAAADQAMVANSDNG